MTRAEFIKYIIENNLTISESKQKWTDLYDIDTKLYIELSKITIRDILEYDEELLLEYPDEKYVEYYKNLIFFNKNRLLYFFDMRYFKNKHVTFKQLVSFYIKNYKFDKIR